MALPTRSLSVILVVQLQVKACSVISIRVRLMTLNTVDSVVRGCLGACKRSTQPSVRDLCAARNVESGAPSTQTRKPCVRDAIAAREVESGDGEAVSRARTCKEPESLCVLGDLFFCQLVGHVCCSSKTRRAYSLAGWPCFVLHDNTACVLWEYEGRVVVNTPINYR